MRVAASAYFQHVRRGIACPKLLPVQSFHCCGTSSRDPQGRQAGGRAGDSLADHPLDALDCLSHLHPVGCSPSPSIHHASPLRRGLPHVNDDKTMIRTPSIQKPRAYHSHRKSSNLLGRSGGGGARPSPDDSGRTSFTLDFRSVDTFLLGLRVIWCCIILYGEVWTFSNAAKGCRWPSNFGYEVRERVVSRTFIHSRKHTPREGGRADVRVIVSPTSPRVWSWCPSDYWW